jgi:hypothetical protein
MGVYVLRASAGATRLMLNAERKELVAHFIHTLNLAQHLIPHDIMD